MFPIRFMSLVLVTSQMLSNPVLSGNSNDRIDDVLAQLIRMGKRMDSVVTNMGKMEKQMKDVTDTEEQVMMKVAKMEDAMWKMNEKMAEEDKKIGDVKNQISEVKTQMGKIEDVMSSVVWKWYGFGLYGTQEAWVYKHHTTQTECLAFCNNKRATEGAEWNGMNWLPSNGLCECSKNDQGHNPSEPSWMHWKTI